MPTAFSEDVAFGAAVAFGGNVTGFDRTKLVTDLLKSVLIPHTSFRVWDALETLLPGTSAGDDLGLIEGAFGTNSPMLKTYDVKAAGAVTLRARVIWPIPIEYVAAGGLTIRAHAGMQTTVADTTATIDFEAYKSNEFGGIGSDLVSVAAQSINSLTSANKDFTLTTASLSPGDWLDIRASIAVNDAATATAVIAALGSVKMLYDARG